MHDLIFISFFLYRAVFQMCGDCQNGQAKELLNYELEVENTVLNPMNLILEVSSFKLILFLLEFFADLFCSFFLQLMFGDSHFIFLRKPTQ